MKKLKFLAILFLLIACGRNQLTSSDKAIVHEITLVDIKEDGQNYKFKVFLLSKGGDLDPYFYTNIQYNVGDTLYFSTKPQ